MSGLKGSPMPLNPPMCSVCDDTLWIPVQVGDETKMKACECQIWKRKKTLIERWIPAMWRDVRVSTLEPSHALDGIFPYKNQIEVIKKIQEKPLKAHSFFGPSGVGKSRFLFALLREAIEEKCKYLFFSKMAPMIRAIRDNEFHRLPPERMHEVIIPEALEKCKDEPMHIFIDEFDKIPITEDVGLKVFELLDYIYEHQDLAKLVIASNLSQKNFLDIWGEAIYRRIEAITNVHILGRR